MALQRFDELSAPPIVGKFYLVWCVRGRWCGELADWPVWGVKHEDAKWIGFEQVHWHLNRFFLSDDDAERAIAKPLGEKFGYRGYDDNNPLPPSVLRRRKCLQAKAAPFPIERALQSAPWREMFKHFSGEQCAHAKGGWKCPHKGFDLGPIAPNADGIIMCPLHGMKINAATGIVEAPQ